MLLLSNAIQVKRMIIRVALVGLMATGLMGCGAPAAETEKTRVIPSPEQARSALSAALDAWKGGSTASSLKSSKPTIEVVDSFRKTERPLKAFEILAPIEVDHGRSFSVRLSLDGPAEEQLARYLVIGKDPIWVFRQEDFERISHWEHKMEEPEPTAPTEPAPRPEGHPAAHGG
jgi:hypothetical protein